MKAQLKRTTFLDTYLALPQSSSQLSAQSSPRQPSPPLQSRESQPSLRRPPGAQCSLPHYPQSQHVNHESLPFTRHILNQLAVEGKYREGVWVGIPKKRRSSMQETDTYKVALIEILERIALLTKEYYRGIVSVPGRWIDPNSTSLQSWTRTTCPDLTPDIIFAHDETSGDEIFWSRTVSVLEFKKPPALEELDIYVTYIFAEQVDRLFVNTLTLKGCELQSPEDFIRVIASFSYLSPADLGWDSTCKVWDSATKSPRPSYKLSQDTFRGRGVYDIPWVFEVADESFVAIGPVNGKRSLSILGRASFVAHAVTLEDWENRNKKARIYIFKQCWQRLPRLESDPKSIELRNADKKTPDQSDRDELVRQIGDVDAKPFEETVLERAGWMDRLRKSWTVEMNGKPVTTFDTIRKNHATEASMGREDSPERLCTNDMEFTSSSSATTPDTLDTVQNDLAHSVLVSRTLVRLVFDRPGWPIERFTSKRELLLAVRMIVEELGSLYKKGIIHRDVSPGNLIISDSGGHIIDFDHSKITFEIGKVAVQRKESEDVLEVASAILENKDAAENYVRQLKHLWKVKDRLATPTDFRWPMIVIKEIYPSYLPLTLEGPGGKKRQNPPRDIIKSYYDGGPHQKFLMAYDFLVHGNEFKAMTASYSNYFKDLIPLMEKWYRFPNIACGFKGFEYHQHHEILIKIIDEAIESLGPEAEKGYEDDAEEEKQRRKQEKDDMGKAISKQMTVTTLLKETKAGSMLVTGATPPTDSVSAVCNQPPVMASPGPSTPLVNRIPAARSPETDRVVKMFRANPPEPEST
ncbi:hypothetical protein AGABI2DRAFT_176932 [Agaricus bisporus var. bisporus H97]|uniref:hypothetical protein n=1 Tax=Agaricus bisporus var. bisporus (strain H97 / ATCC MYA-4626 / FGSC 10389) TaxID=936046 RepID=UPI00029F783A|nr:hypothetical protein AGABI2DRAFT_176932 [Agaricus bisporus var. bisporus H97]EKV50644.1 hypothetical protein AGABI2DRAFT_176932 [Agaricus bisporus var. bisporus H97]